MRALRYPHGSELRPDRRVAAVAARQHGQVALAQLLAAGLTKRQVAGRVARGWLHPVHRGVYSVGAPPTSDHARWMAATLAIPEAVLAGRSAAALWRIWRNARSRECVLTERRVRSRPDLRVRTERLDPRDATRHDAIRVTTVARTLLDAAAQLSPRQLADALTQARVQRLVRDEDLRDVLARHPRHRGTRRLGDALTGPVTRSRLERRFLALLGGHPELPRPATNHHIGRDECDAVWPRHRLVVELDGPHHAGQWAADAAKQQRLEAAGWRVLRFTLWDVDRDGARTLARLRAALAA